MGEKARSNEGEGMIVRVEEHLDPASELVEVGDFGKPRDAAELFVNQVVTAVSLSIAPIADQADEALTALILASGEAPPEGLTVRLWLEAIAHRELLGLRAAALWPYPAGTPVQVDNEGRVFRSVTKSPARGMSDRTVVVDLEDLVGAIPVEKLTRIEAGR